jgi:type III secretion system FlhB-like substrate exporter
MSEPRLRVAALRYDHPKDRAPKLVARGERHVAERILALVAEILACLYRAHLAAGRRPV